VDFLNDSLMPKWYVITEVITIVVILFVIIGAFVWPGMPVKVSP